MSEPRLRASLLIAGAGAILTLIDVAGLAGSLAGLGLIVLGTLLVAPAARLGGRGELRWWRLLAAGTTLAAIGIPLGLALETVGGLLTAAGGALVVVGAALGFP
jgi:hypothetical protein